MSAMRQALDAQWEKEWQRQCRERDEQRAREREEQRAREEADAQAARDQQEHLLAQ